ncbi:uncharacterized protein LOC104584920 [Brachypodium distachyon]|uniref:uncharacterized protein LOC104584920 n=1 Tax=Brachypodium distachyon TaxID=15368 RepID=UPI00052FE597|nr:uncharacterized protein LOC104584920 [Brachypodium distachyon]|eukprot:XP_010239044.1 uncharacterized protein LOC104584920 [Brachypodium distachyon]
MSDKMTKYLMSCYHADCCEMVFPERGKIAVDANSVKRIWDLPNRGQPVPYVVDHDANHTIVEMYGLENAKLAQLSTWVNMIKDMNGTADDNFFRAWLIAAISGFLRPSTSTKVSPKSFLAVLDLTKLPDLDFCQFVADSIQHAFLDLGDKKNSVSCCVFHLLMLYLDSLDHGERISGCGMRVQAWTPALIKKVIKKDTKEDGQFGKLPLKDKKRKIADLVSSFCTDISKHISMKMSAFVQGIAKIYEESDGASSSNPTRKRPRTDDDESEFEDGEDSVEEDEEGATGDDDNLTSSDESGSDGDGASKDFLSFEENVQKKAFDEVAASELKRDDEKKWLAEYEPVGFFDVLDTLSDEGMDFGDHHLPAAAAVDRGAEEASGGVPEEERGAAPGSSPILRTGIETRCKL